MGFSLGHIVLLLLVGIIVIGPKRLPGAMRTAGQWIARIRRMSTDLRSQSGLDDILRSEGLDEHLHELRSLSRFNVVDTLMAPGVPASAARGARPAAVNAGPSVPAKALPPVEPSREREHPLVGCDAYGAVADDVAVYLDGGSPNPSDLPRPVGASPAPEGPLA